jgi:hypothetical protein
VYVECKVASGNSTSGFAWRRNHDTYGGSASTTDDFFRNTVDVAREADYWAVAVAWCYDSFRRTPVGGLCLAHGKASYRGDDDPELEGTPGGDGDRTTVLGIANGIPGTSTDIFVESLRDRSFGEIRTTTHEVGHLMGLSHATYSAPFPDPDDNGLMRWNRPTTSPSFCRHDWSTLLKGTTVNDRFSNNNIKDLRNQTSF